ncbi:MAG TPA: hypothetical protein VK063_02460 [Beutenbergiaceae bacterium]|nr:hypothetical protein [Beutenbergiaceae bacterium]
MWRGPLRRCEEETVSLCAQEYPPRAGLPVWALTPYLGGPRRMVLQWKNHVRADLRPFFGAVGRLGAAQLAPMLAGPDGGGYDGDGIGGDWVGGDGVGGDGLDGGEELVVVPAPSGWRRRLRRQLVVADLARAVTEGLQQKFQPGAQQCGWRGPNVRVRTADVLRTPDASLHRLGASQRAASRRVRLRPGEPPAGPVLLVDDVVTTGSTLAACRRALAANGIHVLGALVLAATPPPGSTTWQ